MSRASMAVATAIMVLGLSLNATIPAHAVLPAGNLLINPGAEDGPGAASPGAVSRPPGWTTIPDFTAVQYGASSEFPDAAVSSEIGGGVNFFAGGPDNDLSTATQQIDLAAAAPEIDAGTTEAILSGYIGGSGTQEDEGTVDAAFLDGAGALLGGVTIGPVDATDRNFVTTLLSRRASAPVPVGTRAIHVTMTASRFDGTYNDAYFDNLDLRVQEVPEPCQRDPKAVCGSDEGEEITGTTGDDVIYAGAGDDVIEGLGGDDEIFGEGGADKITGGDGDDYLDGGFDEGQPGPWFQEQDPGEDGVDVIDGGGGNDNILGGEGGDDLVGGSGVDTLDGEEGDDEADGGDGNDSMFGRGGADFFRGGAGNDKVKGHGGSDDLEGGSGNDKLDGGPNRDIMDGSIGDDLCVFTKDDELISCERKSRHRSRHRFLARPENMLAAQMLPAARGVHRTAA